ncbi:MAG: hypothetical protein HOP09_00425 [Hyphomicrobium sp.]|nr:hypothetical protein [Hyphomicrobium sp.]
MGQKTQTILIRPARLDDGPDQLLADLGFEKRRRICETPFSKGGPCSIWIGALGDCIVIYSDFAFAPFDEAPADSEAFKSFEESILRCFADADIAALTLHSVVGAWGFAVFRNGALVRRQSGADGTIDCDEGQRLEEEDAYLSKLVRVDVQGAVIYRSQDDADDGDLSEADFGPELTSEICRSFTGFAINSRELADARGTEFWLNDDEAEHTARLKKSQATTPIQQLSRPWWKFWA